MSTTSESEQLKREVGQHFVLGFNGFEVNNDARTLIRDYHVGNIILMTRNIQSHEQVHKLIQGLQQLAKDSGQEQPLMIGIDQENGLVSRFSLPSGEAGTQFPGAMALAATGSPKLAEDITAASAREMHLAGINWAYSPVADVNSDPLNPVIGVRSYGDDPEEVSKYTVAVSRGLTSAGIAPSAKHFPGHGDTHVDSHLGLPRILKTKDQLLATELVPFDSIVKDKIASIMTGHMALPIIVGDDTPCSLSRKITTDLLRTEMGYEGLIVTDCLEMDAVKENYGIEKGSVMALQAGADIVMICHTLKNQIGAVKLAVEAVEKGEISKTELLASGERIKALKNKFAGTWSHVLGSQLDTTKLSELKSRNADLSSKGYAASTALIHNPSILPLKLDSKDSIILFTPEMESLNPAVDDAEILLRNKDGNLRSIANPSDVAFFRSLISRRSPGDKQLHHVYTKDLSVPADVEIQLRSAKYFVFATRNADRRPWQIDYLRKIASKAPNASVVIVATSTPYDLLNLNGGGDLEFSYAYLASFEFTPPALEAAAAVMFGEVVASGKVPVLGGKVVASK